ncbi:MAG: endonuclease III [Candidatus Uhrbacteria bacterium]|nr:endonuclease III [Candidatus Uhrbacteria bacterium]
MNQQNIIETIKRLRRLYPGGGALEVGIPPFAKGGSSPYHMLVMVILSARTRDEQVLKLAPVFFTAFPTVHALAHAELADVTAALSSIGMFRQKAKNILAMAKAVVEQHGGEIPSTMEQLIALPGVGRKTASVVLVALFDTPAIAVDVHVQRITQRLGWTEATTPEKIEKQLRERVPKSLWADLNHVFVPFGRAVCTLGKPRCWSCPLVDVCAFANKNLERPPNAEAILAAAREQQENIERLKQNLAKTL